MEQSDIDKLLKLRSAWDKFKIAKKTAHKDFEDFYQVFWSYGMQSRHELAAFNDAMIIQLLKEVYTMRGECDQCKGYKGEPPCKLAWGNESCAVIKVPTHQDPDKWYRTILSGIRLGLRPPPADTVKHLDRMVTHNSPGTLSVKGNVFHTICPPGHGYYYDYPYPIEKAAFDLTWDV